jgi:hypothetical protein
VGKAKPHHVSRNLLAVVGMALTRLCHPTIFLVIASGAKQSIVP